MLRQRQRMERCICRQRMPMTASPHQKLGGMHGTDYPSEPSKKKTKQNKTKEQTKNPPADTCILDFEPPEWRQ